MNRKELLEDLSDYAPADAREAESLAWIRRFLAAPADPFARENPQGHITASAVVARPDGSAFLLLHHRKLGRWLQPGGHADGDHRLAGVALREATEETGISGLRVLVPAVDVDIHPVDHRDALGEHLHLDVRFVVVAPPGAVEVGNHESLGLRWVTWDELPDAVDEEGILRLARAAHPFCSFDHTDDGVIERTEWG